MAANMNDNEPTLGGVLAKLRQAVDGGGLVHKPREEAAEYPDGAAAILLSAIADLEKIIAAQRH